MPRSFHSTCCGHLNNLWLQGAGWCGSNTVGLYLGGDLLESQPWRPHSVMNTSTSPCRIFGVTCIRLQLLII
jgi:hypothetical protein